MNNREAPFVQYKYIRPEYRQSPSLRSPFDEAFGSIFATAVLIAACLVLYASSPDELLTKVLGLGVRMASRISVGLTRLQGGPRFRGYEASALRNVFGFDGAIMKNGLGTLLKGSASDEPPGLGNMSNSCYQNSIIQGLASIRSLPRYLAGVSVGRSSVSTTSGALLEMLDKLNDPTSKGQHFWLPEKLKSMSTWQQQDAQEYYSKILDQVEREAATISRRPKSVSLGLRDVLENEKTAANSSESSSKMAELQNPLEGMLAQRVGCMRCGHSDGLSLIPFNCLTVPLGTEHFCDVRDCLDEYTKLEEIDGVECPSCTLLRAKTQLEQISRRDGTPEALRASVRNRLGHIEDALYDEDFSDHTIIKKCQVPKKQWVSSTKSKQAVIARSPKSLVIHVNRSLFDEHTSEQTKNDANVQFPLDFDLGSWCLGSRRRSPNAEDDSEENWVVNPSMSMLSHEEKDILSSPCRYELRAVVTHSGRHENGHYVCYRKRLPSREDVNGLIVDKDAGGNALLGASKEAWWRLSDEDVNTTTEDTVLRQGGVFMLFYERIDPPIEDAQHPACDDILATRKTTFVKPAALNVLAENMNAAQYGLPDNDVDEDINIRPGGINLTPPLTTQEEISGPPFFVSTEEEQGESESTSAFQLTEDATATDLASPKPAPREFIVNSPNPMLNDVTSSDADSSSTVGFHGSAAGSSVAEFRDTDDGSTVTSLESSDTSEFGSEVGHGSEPGHDTFLKEGIYMRTSRIGPSPSPEESLQPSGLRMVTT